MHQPQDPNWFGGYFGQEGTLEGNWTQLPRLETCYNDPGELWAERNDITCVVNWPSGRAGAAMAIRTDPTTGSRQLWVHGGFRTQFPCVFCRACRAPRLHVLNSC